MQTAIVVAIVSAIASIAGALVSVFFSMRKEREGDWRKVKFEHYRELMLGLSNIVGSDATPEGHRVVHPVVETGKCGQVFSDDE